MKVPIENTTNDKQIVWNLADAKNKFSEVVNLALHSGPQTVSRRGDKVVIINEKSYQKLRGIEKSFIDFLFKKPGSKGVGVKRNKSSIRKVLA